MNREREIIKEKAQKDVQIYTKILKSDVWKTLSEEYKKEIRSYKRVIAQTDGDIELRRLQGDIRTGELFLDLPQNKLNEAKDILKGD